MHNYEYVQSHIVILQQHVSAISMVSYTESTITI